MRKIVITLVLVVGALFMNGINAQSLNPRYVEKTKKIVVERTRVMDLDAEQTQKLEAAYNDFFLIHQKISKKHEPGSEKFEVEIKKYQRVLNNTIVKISSPKQRKKWTVYKTK